MKNQVLKLDNGDIRKLKFRVLVSCYFKKSDFLKKGLADGPLSEVILIINNGMAVVIVF